MPKNYKIKLTYCFFGIWDEEVKTVDERQLENILQNKLIGTAVKILDTIEE